MDDAKIKILYLSHSAELYGAERSLLQILSTIDRQRFSPIVILPGHGPLEKQIEKLGIPIELLSSLRPWLTRRTGFMGLVHFFAILPFLLVSTLAIRRIIQRNQISLVHSNEMAIVAGAIAAWSTGTPHIWHARTILLGNVPHNFILGPKFVLKTVLRLSKQVIAISHAVAECFDGLEGAEKVRVIHNAVNINSFQPLHSSNESRRLLGLPHDVPLVGQIANVTAVKGYTDFIRAALLVRQIMPDVQFVCVGGMPHPEYKIEVLKLIEELNLSKAIFMAGFHEDISQIMAALDLVVLASHYEPFGRVLIEAMAANKPVVGTRVGGISEIIEEGVTGLLVPPKSPDKLAQAIVTILKTPEMASQMGAAGRARAEDCFSSKQYIKKIQKIYEAILKR